MKPQKIPERLILYPRDIENITGRAPRTARRMLQRVRMAYAKSPEELVTVTEFCEFYGIDLQHVKDFLK